MPGLLTTLQRFLAEPPIRLPGSLVTADWLQQHRTEVNLLDATFAMPNSGRDPQAEFAAGHIPNAQFFSIEDIADMTTALPHMLPSPEAFADAMVALGFDESRPTVIYDDGSLLGACRCWWMLRVFGYDTIALLDGGLPAWESDFPCTNLHDPVMPGTFTPKLRPELVWSGADVLENLTNVQAVLVDARAAPRFKGEQAEPRPGLQRGHIPGSLNLPYNDLLDPQSKRLKPRSAIQILFAEAGAKTDEPLVMTCGSGISACVLAFALYLLGRRDIPVYDGSWAEWGSTAGCPVMLGPPQRPAVDEPGA
ncbi:MAG: 3-mercaptopyruvate sulfurtransferase [Alphaproteobacteria bacterium]|nr:3-mercaptopyruvate sulfurtransferase [Alphaproteobacteria bacterium]